MKIAKQSVELIDKMGSDLGVVNAARVSFHKESELELTSEGQIAVARGVRQHELSSNCFELGEKDQKLLNYLAKHNHWSPFAHTCLQFRIKAPIFVARQLVKHQVGGVWNEVSRRYVDDEPEFFFPEVWRGKPVNAKQGSSDLDITDEYQRIQDTQYTPTDRVRSLCIRAFNAYDDLLDAGTAPELARMVLPQNTMTEWVWTGSLMFFARVCKQRLDPHSQAETREIAQLINDQIPGEFEHSWKALQC